MIKVSEETHLKLKVQAYNSGRNLQEYMRYLADTDISTVEETLPALVEVFKEKEANKTFVQGFEYCFHAIFFDKETLTDGLNDSEYYKGFKDTMDSIED